MRKRIRTHAWFKQTLVLGVALLAIPSAAQAEVTPVASWQPQLDSMERGLLGLINDERVRRGAPPLRNSTTLSTAADRFSKYLVETGQFDHFANGSPWERAEEAGWPTGEGGLCCAENLHRVRTAGATFEGWMNSEGHRGNMLNPRYGLAGIAYYLGGPYGVIWTLMLAEACDPNAQSFAACGETDDRGDSSLAAVTPASEATDDGSERSRPASCARARKLLANRRRALRRARRSGGRIRISRAKRHVRSARRLVHRACQ